MRRPWARCPGTGQTPTAIQEWRGSRFKLVGQCPSCEWWVRLTAAEVLHPHQSRTPTEHLDDRDHGRREHFRSTVLAPVVVPPLTPERHAWVVARLRQVQYDLHVADHHLGAWDVCADASCAATYAAIGRRVDGAGRLF